MEFSLNKFKGSQFPSEIILQNIYCYLRYSLSYRDLEEMAQDRGLDVDHSTIQRWVVKYSPEIESNFRKNKKKVSGSWRMDETYVKVNGKWKYLYRAVDKEGNTIDYLLRAKRNKKAARKFFNKAIDSNGLPDKINIDKSGSNKAGIEGYNQENRTLIEIRQCKYLNNIVEQDHRFIKRIIRPMLGFKSFLSASITLAGIEVVRMLKKNQLLKRKIFASSFDQFCWLAQ